MKKILLLAMVALSLQTWAQNNLLNFDGADDFVETNLTPTGAGFANWTIECWVKGDVAPGSSEHTGPIQGTYVFGINWDHSNSTFRGAASIYVGSVWYAASFGSLSANIWYHLSATYDGENLKAYKDGVLITTNTGPSGNAPDDAISVKLGRNTGGLLCFDGQIDEVRIWNVARSATEIKQNMFNKNLSNAATGLVAYYRFNEGTGITTANSSANNSSYTGTLNNSPAWAASPVQFATNALNFDGTNDEVLISDANALDLTNSITIEAWLYPTSTSTIQSIVSKSSSAINTGYIFPRTDDGWDSFICYLYIGGSWRVLAYNPSTTLINSWHHFACTYDGTTIKLYLDGALVNSQNISGTIAINSNQLCIGRQPGFPEWFTGQIDEVRIWNIARSASEIANNYAVEINPATSGLVAYYNFNQGIASGTNTGLTTLMDNTGSNNGTLTNMVLTSSTSNFVVQNSSLFALPVTWKSFTAKKQNNNVLLEWSTAQEQNTKDFILQHSTNGPEWKNIGIVFAAGNSNTIKQYNFLHTNPINSNNYYRILQRDLDGKSSYSEVRMVKFQNTIDKFQVNGNPIVNGQLQISIFSTCIVNLHSSDGTLLWSKEFATGAQHLDLSKYAKGIYLLKADGQSEKIVVQ